MSVQGAERFLAQASSAVLLRNKKHKCKARTDGRMGRGPTIVHISANSLESSANITLVGGNLKKKKKKNTIV